jgi:hypothetical protein
MGAGIVEVVVHDTMIEMMFERNFVGGFINPVA